MNGVRLLLATALVALPALAYPAVRRSARPRLWAVGNAVSLGAGFVLLEATLIHSALPLILELAGLKAAADACRALGGHLFGYTPFFAAPAGVMALVIAVGAVRGAAATARIHALLRAGARYAPPTPMAGYNTALVPLGSPMVVAVAGEVPRVLISPQLVTALHGGELRAVLRHEMAHLRHRHVRFLLLGSAVESALRFLPWMSRSRDSLRLALERWADEEACSGSAESRSQVRSALHKLGWLAPSGLVRDRITALDDSAWQGVGSPALVWSTALSGIIPLALGLGLTLVSHISQVIRLASVSGG